MTLKENEKEDEAFEIVLSDLPSNKRVYAMRLDNAPAAALVND